MPRALAILNYLPAALCRLLVVAWVASVRYKAPGRDGSARLVRRIVATAR
jgi:hypothetical protein